MKKIIIFISMLALTGCTARSCQRFEKSTQFNERYYDIKQYSGGKLIGQYQFKGILNNSEHSDGYYFFKGDSLIEVSGDVTIKSW